MKSQDEANTCDEGPFCPCTGCGEREAIWLSRDPGQHLCHICEHRRLIGKGQQLRQAALAERLAVDRALAELMHSCSPHRAIVARDILQDQVTSGILSAALRGGDAIREEVTIGFVKSTEAGKHRTESAVSHAHCLCAAIGFAAGIVVRDLFF